MSAAETVTACVICGAPIDTSVRKVRPAITCHNPECKAERNRRCMRDRYRKEHAASGKPPEPRSCVVCGASFVPSDNGRKRIYCSRKCKNVVGNMRAKQGATSARRDPTAETLHDCDCSLGCDMCRAYLGDYRCGDYIASQGPHTLQEIAELLGVTREYVRQIQERALEKIRARKPDMAEYLAIMDGEPGWRTRPRRMERWSVSELPCASTPVNGQRGRLT